MIINCENCGKRFDINDELIPEKGRLVKCSNCKNTWFYKHNEEVNINISSIKNDEIGESKLTKKEDKDEESIFKNINFKVEKEKIINEETQIKEESQNKNETKKSILNTYFNYIIIFIISFIAFVLVVDTFKNSISIYFPQIIQLLDSLYASLADLILFIKDLFN